MNIIAVYLIFFISGMSGLIYQVIWVRNFGNIFGSTIHSSAIVTSVFMCGLGIGSYLAGILVDKRHKNPLSPLKYYAISETVIGLLGYLVSLALRGGERWSAGLSSYKIGQFGWHELTSSSFLIRYISAAVLLLPITLLMGGTLTLLIRFLLTANLQSAGRKTGLLYGFNTAGAALGSLLIDFDLIPKLGLFSTQQIAVFFNLLASVSAWLLFRRLEHQNIEYQALNLNSREVTSQTIFSPICAMSMAVLFSGMAGMGMEIVWFRYLTSAIGQFRSTFSLLLAVILLGIWIGSICAGELSQRIKRPRLLYCLSILGFIVTALAALLTPDVSTALPKDFGDPFFRLSFSQRRLHEFWLIFVPVMKLVGFPSFWMGFSFPLANAIVQDTREVIGKRAGILYLSNTAGAVFGSLFAGFFLLPIYGMKWSVLACCLLALLALIPIFISARGKKHDLSVFSILIPSGVALIFLINWIMIPSDFLILKSFRSKDSVGNYLKTPYLMKMNEGLSESIVILKIPEDGGGKRLYTNGHIMSGSAPGAQRYMRALVHIPLLNMTQPKNVLVICFGVGNTLHAASLYPTLSNLEIVDLSKNILSQAEIFSDSNENVLKDQRVSVFVNDGRQHLRFPRQNKYDLITLEPPPISFAGVASLYSEEFYKLAYENLEPGGYLTQWLPIKELPGDISRSLIKAFIDVFPNTILLAGEYGDFILMGRKGDSIQFDPERVAKNISAYPRVRQDLETNNLLDLTDLVGMFLADSTTLAKAVENDDPITDDDPFMEYAQILYLNSIVPLEIMDNSRVKSWCPKCYVDGKPIYQLKRLGNYLKFMDAMLKDRSFAFIGPFSSNRSYIEHVPLTIHDFKDLVDHSPYLSKLLGRFNFKRSNFL